MIIIKEIVKKSLSDEVYERIIQDIRSGSLGEGSKVPSENFLSRSLNVSRAVVREALQRMREEHIIVTYKGSGSFIANPQNFIEQNYDFDFDFNRFCEVMEFRSCIEFAAIKRFVQRADSAEIDELNKILAKMKDSVDDPILFTKFDYEFHFSIIKSSHNSVFVEVMESWRDDIVKCLGAMNKLNNSRSWALSLHEKLYFKLKEHDSKAAIDLLKNNGEYNIARFEEFLK